jgi:penicillin-binding protein 2
MERTGRLSTPRAARARRAWGARIVVLLMMGVMVSALVRLQVVNADELMVRARNNRLRPMEVPAPRGTIYDRHGNVVAQNTVGYKVLLMPGPRDSMQAQIERLRPILGLTDAGLRVAWQRFALAPNFPMVVLSDTPPVAAARIAERRRDFPNVLVHTYAKRDYPHAEAVAHFMGYVAEISAEELETERFQDYEQRRLIGKEGLERQYEEHLGGQPGTRYLEIDAMGTIKSWLPEELGVAPIPGRDLHLHLDLDLQRYVYEIFPEGYSGGFVAVDPKTGGILAMVSKPGYDINRRTGGTAIAFWDSLRADPLKPLLDRVAGSGAAQPPASTWKLPVAAIALEEGLITPDEFMPISCTGGMSYQGRYARCHDVHGRNNLYLGIANSCDVYFYQVGIRLGLERYLAVGTRLGYGERTGVDLPSEMKPIFPESIEWLERRGGYRPPANHVMSLSIGQGEVTMTPLKLAQIYTALARPDAKAPELRLADTGEKPGLGIDLGIQLENLEALRRGMREVVSPNRTAYLTRIEHWDFMGKTGTAQACTNCSLPDHGWFAAVGGPPDGNPDIVAVLFLEYGLSGSRTSNTVGNAVNFYLNRKYGRAFERYPVPRERSALNLPVDWAYLARPILDNPFDVAAFRANAITFEDEARAQPAVTDSVPPGVGQGN